jgi:hypothetical protein
LTSRADGHRFNDERTWPADVLDYLERNRDLFLAWEDRTGSSGSVSGQQYDKALHRLRADLNRHQLLGYSLHPAYESRDWPYRATLLADFDWQRQVDLSARLVARYPRLGHQPRMTMNLSEPILILLKFRPTLNQRVPGSSPGAPTNLINDLDLAETSR